MRYCSRGVLLNGYRVRMLGLLVVGVSEKEGVSE